MDSPRAKDRLSSLTRTRCPAFDRIPSSWLPYGNFSRGRLEDGRRDERPWDPGGQIRSAGLDEVLDAWCISGLEGVAKPDRLIFEEAAKRCGAPLEGWMVGDTPEIDVLGGNAAGLRTIWMARGRPWSVTEYAQHDCERYRRSHEGNNGKTLTRFSYMVSGGIVARRAWTTREETPFARQPRRALRALHH